MRVYGPVLSWRLGRSLGIDVVGPEKTCCFDCVYCQLGSTINKLSEPEELEVVLREELEGLVEQLDMDCVDYVTFSGRGEPTLNLNLGKLVKLVKEVTGKPVAVFTNSAFLGDERVRENLEDVDLVIAKLDAPTKELFERINRPVEGVSFEDVVEGLKSLEGGLIVQCMFLKMDDFSNDSEEALEGLRELLLEIEPDEVQVSTVYRPSLQSGVSVEALPVERLKEVAKFFEEEGLNSVYYDGEPVDKEVKWDSWKDVDERVLELVKRRPSSLKDLSISLGLPASYVIPSLRKFQQDGLIGEKGDFFVFRA